MRRLLSAVLVVGLALPGAYAGASSHSSSHSSSKSSSKPKSSSGGKVHVKGYTKKDGTYVAPHDRNAPHAKGSSSSTSSAAAATGSTHSTAAASSAPAGKHACANCERDAEGHIKRSEKARGEFMRQTGYPNGRPGYVVDHITPLECGGNDEPANMQWQTEADAKLKDKSEHSCRQ